MHLSKIAILTAAAFSAVATTSFAVSYNGSYSENFDSMGTTGTALPAGFTYFVGESGTSNTTWSNATGIIANGATGSVASMVPNTNGLTATTTPSGTNNNGFNAATSSANTSDRVAATSPTQVSGAAFDLTLTNTTGATIGSLTLGYTIQRFTAVATANELPGYSVFVSMDAATWTQIAVFTPTIDGANGTIAVPNTIGSTVVSPTTFALPSNWSAGSNLDIRWVDDNAVQTSPDQIIGLNNITIVPEPSTWATVSLSLGILAGLVLRRRTFRA